MQEITKQYGQWSRGQVHARCIDSAGATNGPALVCLHPAPSSGLYFTTAMPLLNAGRQVIAPDYPGYGGSDRLDHQSDDHPTIADYANAMLEFLSSIDIEVPVDILGFHTGCLVAAEMALIAPTRVRRLVLCDVPYFDAEQRKNLHKKMAQPLNLSGELESLSGPWNFNITSRIDSVPIPRAVELLAEHLRAGNNDHLGFAAAFSYDCDARFAELNGDITLLATQSGLHEPTVQASHLIKNSNYVDVPEVTTAVFETGAKAISLRVDEVLRQ
jgi:pimeloyl-ACP methyl ester carboxylesterase